VDETSFIQQWGDTVGFSILTNIATGFDFLLEPVDIENISQSPC